MKIRITPVLLVGIALAGCEQTSQHLPFTVDDVVEQTVATTGGMVSTPAGASVVFPSGSVDTPVRVTLQIVPSAGPTASSGRAVSETFRLEPFGLELKEEAQAELKFSALSDPARAWLATLVSSGNGRVREHGDTRVELRSGLASTRIDRLGNLTVVLPPSDAVVPVTRMPARTSRMATGTAAAYVPTGRVLVECGDPDDRCTGISVTATDNLLDDIDSAAALYPAISGRLSVSSPSVADSIVVRTSIRALLQSGQTAENVIVRALLRPTAATVASETATEIRLSNVHFRISGDADASGTGVREETATLVIAKAGGVGTISLARSFRHRNDAGQLEDATLTVAFPVEIQP